MRAISKHCDRFPMARVKARVVRANCRRHTRLEAIDVDDRACLNAKPPVQGNPGTAAAGLSLLLDLPCIAPPLNQLILVRCFATENGFRAYRSLAVSSRLCCTGWLSVGTMQHYQTRVQDVCSTDEALIPSGTGCTHQIMSPKKEGPFLSWSFPFFHRTDSSR